MRCGAGRKLGGCDCSRDCRLRPVPARSEAEPLGPGRGQSPALRCRADLRDSGVAVLLHAQSTTGSNIGSATGSRSCDARMRCRTQRRSGRSAIDRCVPTPSTTRSEGTIKVRCGDRVSGQPLDARRARRVDTRSRGRRTAFRSRSLRSCSTPDRSRLVNARSATFCRTSGRNIPPARGRSKSAGEKRPASAPQTSAIAVEAIGWERTASCWALPTALGRC